MRVEDLAFDVEADADARREARATPLLATRSTRAAKDARSCPVGIAFDSNARGSEHSVALFEKGVTVAMAGWA